MWVGFRWTRPARIEVEGVQKHLNEGSGIERIAFGVRGRAAREAFERALAAEQGA